jgi:integrase/recombinase XerD
MLPNPKILRQIPWRIFSIPNHRKESKRKVHYNLFLLCHEAGLRISEAINFDLNAKSKHGLYRLNKTKGKKERYVYIPKKVVSKLKKYNWQPNRTNRFNFYHFLRKIKRELNLPTSTELTPHTLHRAFTTYQVEAGLPLPLLQKLLGHNSIRTTALYWMNIYHGGDDDDNDTGSILAGKN